MARSESDTTVDSWRHQEAEPVPEGRTPTPASAGRRYVTEVIGTFFLVLTIGCTVLLAAPLAPLAIGAALMVMIYAGGHISGAHFNPAITLGVFLRGRLAGRDVAPYMLAQIVGALAAALAAWYITSKHPVAQPIQGSTVGPALLAELLMTFALVWVVLNVATSASHPHNSFYGLAIGFTVLAGAVAVGGISGGAFNPAVAVGASLMGLAAWSNLWIYLLADLVGGALAALAFRMLNPHDR